MAQPWRMEPDGVRLSVRVTPRASRDEAHGIWRDADDQPWLSVKVRAAPDDGQANKACVATLAKALGLSRSSITLESGAAARLKRFKIVCNTYETMTRLSVIAGERA